MTLTNRSQVISYKNLRRLIGILGILLPFICYFGGKIFSSIILQSTISAYYYTNVRDIFVGLLICVGLFLLTYRGYEHIDTLVSSLTGLAGFAIAVFPCLPHGNAPDKVGFFQLSPKISDKVHVICAALFFILLAINSIFIFTLSDKGKEKSKNKKIRNYVYIACGVIILLMLFLIVLVNIFKELRFFNQIVFVLESICLFSFGFSWLVKGETLFKDKI